MNDDYLEFSLLDVNDESFLASNEEIICRHCQVISYIEYGAKEEKEIIDFSCYDFNTGKGKIIWGNYYTDMGINQFSINNDCMVSQKLLPNGQYEFYWWPAGTITFFKE